MVFLAYENILFAYFIWLLQLSYDVNRPGNIMHPPVLQIEAMCESHGQFHSRVLKSWN